MSRWKEKSDWNGVLDRGDELQTECETGLYHGDHQSYAHIAKIGTASLVIVAYAALTLSCTRFRWFWSCTVGYGSVKPLPMVNIARIHG